MVYSQERRKKLKVYLLLNLAEVNNQLKKSGNHINSLFSILDQHVCLRGHLLQDRHHIGNTHTRIRKKHQNEICKIVLRIDTNKNSR